MSSATATFTEAEKRALDAYTKLMRAADSITARIGRHMGAADLTVSQFGVLEALYHKGPLCQRDIASKILKSSGNMTVVIDNLERRGLVRRERGEEDRRYITIHLTDAGRALISEVFPRVREAIVAEMSILGENEQEDLARLCRTIGLRERKTRGG